MYDREVRVTNTKGDLLFQQNFDRWPAGGENAALVYGLWRVDPNLLPLVLIEYDKMPVAKHVPTYLKKKALPCPSPTAPTAEP